ncbi:MAG: hypothetical protein GX359_01945 [Clostridiales bacterium]|nr:hypothetical protein [Clostridiales bacterium]
MEKRKSKKILYLITTFTAAAALFGALRLGKAIAAEPDVQTVEMRIIGTTDIHGQLNSTDYELNVDYSNGGIARVFDMIQQTKAELPKENTVTLDTGDTLFDYTTEYIFSKYYNEIQPIYKAMAMVGYDAITLGNHEFDYGYEYLLNQLNGSGLRDITVVSNVTDSKTGEHPFLENMLITRDMKTKSGDTVEVKVGIIGQTIPTLTGKTHSYAGILKGEDMVANAKVQAAKLKEMGADVIIALSHTGIGPENPEPNFKNVAYALTKIDDIDVVVCGHEHNLFPTTDMTSAYYKLPNVDKKTYLINGKNVIMAGDRGRAIGVVDLTLEIKNGRVKIVDRSSELRMITRENTKENKEIASLFGDLNKELMAYSTDVIGELEKGTVIQNYYGLLGDNTAIQLLNNAKISYALDYVVNNAPEYIDYPIVAASTYDSYGVGSIDDFVTIRDEITESDLAKLQNYNSYLYVYSITGKQLKEWLEWSASAYETILFTNEWSDKHMAELMKETNLKSLIREEWLDDWSSFYIFDGIDYVINPTVEPRYDFSGNKISVNERIKSVTYNGKEVTDDMKLLIATNKITKPVGANRGVENQVVYKSFNRSQAVLAAYLKQLSQSGSILPQVDYNWKVDFPSNYKFIIKAPYYADNLFKATPWYEEDLIEAEGYRYYVASYPKSFEDNDGPSIIAISSITSPTGSPFDVEVYVTDASEIKHVRYMKGDYEEDYNGWVAARRVTNRTFTVHENGIYSIYAEDIHGNKTIKKIVVNNFSDDLLGRPTSEKYTNRKSNIKGTGEPGATIVFEAYTGVYKGKVGTNGKYAYPLPSQPSGSTVTYYVVDDKGVESERVTVPVHRTGPNQPTVNPLYNNIPYITGTTNDSDATVIAIVDGTVYLADDGGKELYETNTEIYDPSYKIVETHFEVDSTGHFALYVPSLYAGKTVTIYNLDHVSRNSRVLTAKVSEITPNTPQAYEISNIERSLTGYVPEGNKSYRITLKIGDKTYTTNSDKSGRFTFQFNDQLQAGQVLTITASDSKNGSTRTSYPREIIVNDIKDYVRTNSTTLTIDNVTTKSNLITGNSEDSKTVYLAIVDPNKDTFTNELHVLETNDFNRYRYRLEDKLELGTKVYVMARFTDGRILTANTFEVLAGRPNMPDLLKEITNTDKKVQVVANKDCEVSLTIGKKNYTTSEYVYDEEDNIYIYTFETDRDVSGTKVTITASNTMGTSDPFTSQLIKVAPDQPKVDTIKAGKKKITGKVEVLDEETEVYAQIGKKKYKGSVDKKGNFEIEIPKAKALDKIKVWGTNKAGRGPLISVIVEK